MPANSAIPVLLLNQTLVKGPLTSINTYQIVMTTQVNSTAEARNISGMTSLANVSSVHDCSHEI